MHHCGARISMAATNTRTYVRVFGGVRYSHRERGRETNTPGFNIPKLPLEPTCPVSVVAPAYAPLFGTLTLPTNPPPPRAMNLRAVEMTHSHVTIIFCASPPPHTHTDRHRHRHTHTHNPYTHGRDFLRHARFVSHAPVVVASIGREINPYVNGWLHEYFHKAIAGWCPWGWCWRWSVGSANSDARLLGACPSTRFQPAPDILSVGCW